MKMKKILAVLMAMILVVGCFAACGGKEKTIVVGYTIYEPMNYLDDEGKLVGFDTELAETVFKNLGYDKVVFKEIKWENKYTELEAGTIDCIWNGFTCNTKDDDGVARADKVDFSYNYMENLQVVVVKKDSTIKTLEDLDGKVAYAENGSAGESYAKSLGDNIIFKGVDAQTDALFNVKSGDADFAVLDAQLAKSYCGKGDYANLMVVEGLSSEVEYYAVGFKKGSDLTAKVNEQFVALAADGTITKLAEKYGVSNSVITDFSSQK